MTTFRNICVALAATAALGAAAQQRIAVVNVQEIFAAMPDRVMAQKQLDDLSAQFNREYQVVQREFNNKFADYQGLDANTPASIRERRVQELQQGDARVQSYLTKAQHELKQREQELNAPIKQRLDQAIKAVGQEGGYTYIIDLSTGAVPYMGSDAIDVTPLVRAKLGM